MTFLTVRRPTWLHSFGSPLPVRNSFLHWTRLRRSNRLVASCHEIVSLTSRCAGLPSRCSARPVNVTVGQTNWAKVHRGDKSTHFKKTGRGPTGMIYAKPFFDLQLEFAHKVTVLSGLPLARALFEYTNFYSRFGSGRDFELDRIEEVRRQRELTSHGIASGKRCVRSDGHRAIGAAGDTPRGVRGRPSDAVVAKCAGLHHSGRSESVDVETRSHADHMNEAGTMSPTFAMQPMAFGRG